MSTSFHVMSSTFYVILSLLIVMSSEVETSAGWYVLRISPLATLCRDDRIHLGRVLSIKRPRCVLFLCTVTKTGYGTRQAERAFRLSSRSMPRTDGERFCHRCCREYCHANRHDYHYAKFYVSLLLCDITPRCYMKTILLCSTRSHNLPQNAYNALVCWGCDMKCSISCSTCRVLRYSSTYQIRSTSNYLIIRHNNLWGRFCPPSEC